MNDLVSIHPVTGAGTVIATLHGDITEAVDPGLAFDPWTKTLYMTEQNTDSLYTIHTATGQATLVGPLGHHVASSGLAFDPLSRVLWESSYRYIASPHYYSAHMYTVNTDTGAATEEDSFALPQWAVGPSGLAFDPFTRAFFGTVYDLDHQPNEPEYYDLYRIEPGVGISKVGQIGYPVEGLAFAYPASVIPEPSSLITFAGLFGTGLFGYWWRRRRAA